jgi:hypothetical protein
MEEWRKVYRVGVMAQAATQKAAQQQPLLSQVIHSNGRRVGI